MVRRLGLKRAVLIALAASYPALFIDAWIGHEYSGGGISETPQWFPLIFSPLAFVLLLIAAFLAESGARWITRIVGALSVLIGVGGVVFHALPIFKELSEAEGAVNFKAIMSALGDGAPLLAPGAFTAVGLLVMALGSANLILAWNPDREAAAQSPILNPQSGPR